MDATDPQKARLWLRILLFASLALNLLVVGLVAGALLSGPRDRDRNPILRDLGFGPFVNALPRTDKIALTAALREKAGSFRENRRELRRATEEILAALRQDPFDPVAFSALIQEQRSWIQRRQDIGAEALVARISEMTSAERVAYADSITERLRKRPPKPKRD